MYRQEANLTCAWQRHRVGFVEVLGNHGRHRSPCRWHNRRRVAVDEGRVAVEEGRVPAIISCVGGPSPALQPPKLWEGEGEPLLAREADGEAEDLAAPRVAVPRRRRRRSAGERLGFCGGAIGGSTEGTYARESAAGGRSQSCARPAARLGGPARNVAWSGGELRIGDQGEEMARWVAPWQGEKI